MDCTASAFRERLCILVGPSGESPRNYVAFLQVAVDLARRPQHRYSKRIDVLCKKCWESFLNMCTRIPNEERRTAQAMKAAAEVQVDSLLTSAPDACGQIHAPPALASSDHQTERWVRTGTDPGTLKRKVSSWNRTQGRSNGTVVTILTELRRISSTC